MFGCGPKYFSERFNLKLERVYKTYALRMNYTSPMEIVQNNSLLCECSKIIYPRIFVVWQRLNYLCIVNKENYRQLPAKMH